MSFKVGDKIYDVTKRRCKTFYSLSLATKPIPSNGFKKSKADFDLEDDDVKEAFKSSETAPKEAPSNIFQCKI